MYHPNVIYHIYNHTNNRERLFRSEENYLYFTEKLRRHLLPVADILCYCLMPTHFHIMAKPTVLGCQLSRGRKFAKAHQTGAEGMYQQMLSHKLRLLLSSYVKAYNNRFNRRGSLIRAVTKAKPAYSDFLPEDWELDQEVPFTRLVPYLKVCLRYIHQNPVKDGLVRHPMDWAFSSARDYGGVRDNGLCDYVLTERLLGIKRFEG